MCLCKDVEFGSYDVTIPVWYDRRKRVVDIDVCIVLEVLELWNKGIVTIESCCGHNKQPGYIMVEECCIDEMLQLGYKLDTRTEAKGCFMPLKKLNSGL